MSFTSIFCIFRSTDDQRVTQKMWNSDIGFTWPSFNGRWYNSWKKERVKLKRSCLLGDIWSSWLVSWINLIARTRSISSAASWRTHQLCGITSNILQTFNDIKNESSQTWQFLMFNATWLQLYQSAPYSKTEKQYNHSWTENNIIIIDVGDRAPHKLKKTMYNISRLASFGDDLGGTTGGNLTFLPPPTQITHKIPHAST